MLNAKTRLGAEIEKLRFYEWAYGRLTEADSDIGAVGEYMVGRTLGCLNAARKAHDLFDLVMRDGTSVEVKTTTRRVKTAGGLLYRWDVLDQRTALAGERDLAALWVFLIADFPADGARVNALDTRYWRAAVLPGDAVRAAGVTRFVTEKTLARQRAVSGPLADLPRLCAEARSRVVG